MSYSLLNISDDKNNPVNIICFNDVPLYQPNRFLSDKGINSYKTRDSYAKVLLRVFNFFYEKYG